MALHLLADLAPAAPAAAAGPRSQRLTTKQRWAIVNLKEDGRFNTYIAAHVGCSRTTVRDVLARYAATGSPGSGRRNGRPRSTTEDTDISIAVTAHVEVFTTPRQIKRRLELDVSTDTINRRLIEAGLFGRVALHKRDYSAAELQKRLAFANGYGGKSEAWWTKVLFSDEKCFYGKGFCGRIYVRRPKGLANALLPQYTVHKIAHPVKVNAWACFAASGQGYIYIFNENMDAVLMKKILPENLIPSAELHFSMDPPEQWFLLHDNDKKFKSNLVQKLMHDSGVTTIDFPPDSPDLNPMENLWATLARAVEKHAADSIEELQDVIESEWKQVGLAHMRTLACSMPSRCAAVIAALGWHTSY